MEAALYNTVTIEESTQQDLATGAKQSKVRGSKQAATTTTHQCRRNVCSGTKYSVDEL